jgi:hypothetical protein
MSEEKRMSTEIWKSAHETFEEYAAMDVPHLPADPMSALQVRLHRWQVANFGWQPSWAMVLGIAEEALDETQESSNVDELIDAIGDALIYTTQLCTDLRLDFGVLLREAKIRSPIIPVPNATGIGVMASAIGKIARAILKSEQGIRGFNDSDRIRAVVADALVGMLLWCLCRLSKPWMDVEDAYRITAEHVMTRNWRADPVTGGAA